MAVDGHGHSGLAFLVTFGVGRTTVSCLVSDVNEPIILVVIGQYSGI